MPARRHTGRRSSALGLAIAERGAGAGERRRVMVLEEAGGVVMQSREQSSADAMHTRDCPVICLHYIKT